MPVLMGTMPANIEAYAAGKPLPFLAAAVVYYVLVNDAVGNTLALSLNTLFARSEKYKAMKKLVIPANIFNINEPVIFGFPVMLNPLYFIPLILATLGNGMIAVLYMKLITIPVNPAVYLAWVTPRPVFTFLAGGWQFLLLWVVCLVFDYIVWYPFFRVDDRKEYEKEQQIARKNSAST
ncbi:lichenan permease IIC component [Lachnospiraceae bacterium]|nr:lichenan permease IIC component [Lachnospiraceae bacterium]